MHRSGHFPHSLRSSDIETRPAFSVAIIYEDFETGKQARRTYDYLAQHLGQDTPFTYEMWKFDVLNIPRLRELAASDAASADLILIACRGDKPLPDSAKSWIDSFLCENSNAIALVALFLDESGHPEVQQIRQYLQEVANRGHMEFFAQPDHSAAIPSSASGLRLFADNSLQRRQTGFPSLPALEDRYQTFPHWGINE